MKRLGLLGLLGLGLLAACSQPPVAGPTAVPAEFALPAGSVVFQPGQNFPVLGGPGIPGNQSTGIWISEPLTPTWASVPYPHGGQFWAVSATGPNGEYTTPAYKPLKTNVDYLIFASDLPRNTTVPHRGDTGDQFFILGQRVTRRVEMADFNYNHYRMAGAFRIVDGIGTIQ